MIAGSNDTLTDFPPFESHTGDPPIRDKRDSGFELTSALDNHAMANAGSPYIKAEPNDFGFDPQQYMQFGNGQQQQQYNNNNSGSGNMNINPANLTNGGSNGNNNHNMSQSFSQNMGSSFNMGGSGIADDELLDLQFEGGNQPNNFDFNSHGMNFPNQQSNQQNSSVFSQTPDGAPIQSPFNNDFNYSQFRTLSQSVPQQAGFRPHMQHLDRKVSDSRSPGTPNTPGMNNLQINDDFSRPIRHRQQSSLGGNGWDSTPSVHSWNEPSGFPSPPNGQPIHNQISEVLKKNTHHHGVASSLPAKMEGSGSAPGFQTQEAKRRRRRESHNQVERRRRDNINDRIHDLGNLVPQHRLEDEKVRKHLQTNAPLSPSIANATGVDPPSMSLGAPQRRPSTAASGSITVGLPLEDKDKGPNKGDILNGSVAWTRDLMWYTHIKLRQEQELKDLVQKLGGTWPYEQNEEEKRMHGEICEILNKHAPQGGFTGYSRAPGSGLRVPGFTNVAGDSLNEGSSGFPSNGQQGVSPGFQSGGSGMSSGQMSHPHQQPYWNGEFKEEDEYGMEI